MMQSNEISIHQARLDNLVEHIRDLKGAISYLNLTLKENVGDVGYAKLLRKEYKKLLEQNRKYKGDIVPRKDRYIHKLYDELEKLTGDDIPNEDRTYSRMMKDYLGFMEQEPTRGFLEIMDHLPRARSELKASMQLKEVLTKKIRDLHEKYNIPLNANPFRNRRKF
jgi:hypothetical protein